MTLKIIYGFETRKGIKPYTVTEMVPLACIGVFTPGAMKVCIGPIMLDFVVFLSCIEVALNPRNLSASCQSLA